MSEGLYYWRKREDNLKKKPIPINLDGYAKGLKKMRVSL
jgi:hypothetical protein